MSRRTAALGVTVLAVALAFRVLSAGGFWIDEVFTGANVRAGPAAFTDRSLGEPHSPWPIYYALLHGWSQIFAGVAGLKAFSIVLSLAGVVVIGGLAGRLAGPRAGWIAAGLAAVNPMLAWYGGEARMYALWTLLFAGTIAAAWRAEGRDRYADGLGIALLGGLTVLTHVFGAIAVAALGAVVLVRGGRRTRIGLAGGALLGALPAAPTVLRQAEHWLAWKAAVGPEGHVAGPGNLVAAGHSLFTAYAVPLSGLGTARIAAMLVVVAAVGLPVAAAWRARAPHVRTLLGLAFVAIVGPYLVLIRTLMYSPRFTLLALPPLLLVVAIGLDRLAWRPRLVAGGALVALGVVCLAGRAGRTDWREVAAVLEAERRPGETLSFDGGNLVALREWFGPVFAGESSLEPADWTIRFPRERPEADADTWVLGPAKRLIEDEAPVLRRRR